jgi:hypothetical protein
MDTGKLSAWFFVLMILVSNVPVLAAATNSATLTYSGTATGNYTLNLTGQMDADSIDINVTSISNVYDYWIDPDLNTVYVPVNDSVILYIENTAGYSPNGSSVFPLLFDDFSGDSLSSTWSDSMGASIGSGYLTLTASTNQYNYVSSTDSFSADYELYAKTRNTVRTTSVYSLFGTAVHGSINTDVVGQSGCTGYRTAESDTATHGAYIQRYTGSWTNLAYDTYSFSQNTWYVWKTTCTGSGITTGGYALDGTELSNASTTDTTYTSGYVFLTSYVGSGTGTSQYDYAYMKPHIDNEPTVNISDMDAYYQVEITNNEGSGLNGYPVGIDAAQLGISSDSESLKITSDAGGATFQLTASITGDSQTESFGSTTTQNSYSLIPSAAINQIQFTVDDENAIYDYEITVNFDNTAPVISNMSPTGDLDEMQVTFSANISDIDMDAGYDNVSVGFYVSESLIDTVNITESGTVTSGPYTYSNGGAYDWYIIATDELGGVTQSDTETFNIPSQFTIRDAITLELVSTVDVDVMFYEQGELQQTVKRSTTTGVLNLTGLPVDSEFVVVVYADGYAVRNTLIESLYDQSSIYIIPDTEDNNTVVLEITDYTGNFPAVNSKILIQRSINVSVFDDSYDSGTYLWQTMSGDYIGADQTFQDTLLDNERYRFVVKNSDGESRVIGQYNSLDSESLNLVVGELEWEFSRDAGYYAEAWYVDTTDEGEIDNGIIRFQYYDDANLTSSLSVSCYERDNETNVIYTDSTSGTLGEYAASIPLTGEDQINTNWIVDYTIVRDGETLSFTLPISPDGGYMDWPIDGEMGALILGILVLFFALMFGGAVASKGAVILCALVAGIQFVGFYVAPWGVIIFVSAVSVLFLITDTSGDGIQ